ncbi:MAG: energy transducer TonB [Chitinophagales bacterium]
MLSKPFTFVLFLILWIFSIDVTAQKIYTIAEEMPEYPGGEMALYEYLYEVPFPEKYKSPEFKNQIQIQFQIDTAGNVQNIGVKNQTDNDELGLIAIEHIEKMPQWKPGIHLGKKVIVQYVLPIPFERLTPKNKKRKGK